MFCRRLLYVHIVAIISLSSWGRRGSLHIVSFLSSFVRFSTFTVEIRGFSTHSPPFQRASYKHTHSSRYTILCPSTAWVSPELRCSHYPPLPLRLLRARTLPPLRRWTVLPFPPKIVIHLWFSSLSHDVDGVLGLSPSRGP